MRVFCCLQIAPELSLNGRRVYNSLACFWHFTDGDRAADKEGVLLMRITISVLVSALLYVCGPVAANEFRFVTEEFYPFSYSVSEPENPLGSRAGGPLVEVVQLVCKRIQYHCPVAIYPWRRALTLAEQGDADGIFTVVQSPRRDRFLHVTQMLVRSRYSVFSLSSSAFTYRQPADMAGKNIGVYGPSGTSYIVSERLRSVPDTRVHLVVDNRRLLRMLKSGRFGEHGLAIINQDVARNLLKDEGLSGIHEAGELEPVSYGIGFSRRTVSNERFMVFQRALAQAVADGSVPDILRRYGLEPVVE